ncbi:MAG: DUF4097 family beta strand repeat-containing protein [Rhodothermales bacterium]|nr:DUF4097 family beta strand repeat-containing protein [Rhodothermales bacterium]
MNGLIDETQANQPARASAMNDHSRTDESPNDQMPAYKRIMLAILGALALMVLVNVVRGEFSDAGAERLVAVRHAFDTQRATVKVHVMHEGSGEEELMIDERFPAGDPAGLSVSVGDADVVMKNNETGEIHVEVYLKGTDMERARKYFETQAFEVFEENGTVFVKTAENIKWRGGWNTNGGAQITVIVHTPLDLTATIRTSDGDIAADDLRGEIQLTTSDGDIVAGALEGLSVAIRTSDGDIAARSLDAPEVSVVTSDGDIAIERAVGATVNIRTSDGDIVLADADGSVTLSTSDGDIQVDRLSGDEASLRTSDGDIVVREALTGSARVTTSDGSIVLQAVHGDIEARTSSGDLTVEFVEAGSVNLRTSDGDIAITAPRDLRATLLLRGESIRIDSGFSFDGILKKDEADGALNGGGSRFEASATSGEIVLREN